MPLWQKDSPAVPFSTSVPGAFGVGRKGDSVSLAILCSLRDVKLQQVLFGMNLLRLERVILASPPTLLCSRELSTCFVAQEVVEESDKPSLFVPRAKIFWYK